MDDGNAYGHAAYAREHYQPEKDRYQYWKPLLGGINGPAGACVWIQLGKDIKRHY